MVDPAAGVDHRQGPLAAAGPARRRGIPAAGGVRERRESAAGASVGEGARARHSQRARCGARTAGPSISHRSHSCFRWPAAAWACWERSGAWRDWWRWRRRICRGWTASRSVFRYSCSRSSCPRRSPPASGRSPPSARPPGTCARTSSKAGADRAGSQRSQRLGRVIVAAQIAITLVLVVGAGLFGRSLMKVLEVNPGFRVDKHRHDGRLASVGGRSQGQGGPGDFLFEPDRSPETDPGRAQGRRDKRPADGRRPSRRHVSADDAERDPEDHGWPPGAFFQQKERIGIADFCVATDGYFQALGIPLVRGRIFDERDGADSPHVAVISESLARDRWPNQDPIGRTIEFGNMDGDLRLLTIVGIVGDTHVYGLDTPPRPTVYVNLFQRPRAAITLTMLSDADTRIGDVGGARNSAGAQPGDSGEVPDVLAGLFRVAGLAEIQRHSHRVLRNHRAAARNGRGVRRDGLFGQPPHARNRRARRSRGGVRRRL